jgi:hypothetical protein
MHTPVGGYFERNGFTTWARDMLFYTLCLWSRMGLAVGMALMTYYVPFAGSAILCAGSLFAIGYIYLNQSRKNVWWKLQYHLFVAVFAFGIGMIVFACAISESTSDSTNAGLVGGILGFDVVLAIIQKLIYGRRV